MLILLSKYACFYLKPTIYYYPTTIKDILTQKIKEGFPGGAVVENLPANAGDTGSSPGLGRSHMLRSN